MSDKLLRLLGAIAAIAACLFNAHQAVAAKKSISWSDELCENRVVFDPSKVDEQRLKNTLHLLFGPEDFQAPMGPPLIAPQDISKLDLNRTLQQCANALDVGQRLAFLPLDGIEELRQAKLAETKDWCSYETTRIRGFRDPSALRDYQPAAACSGFVDPLEGKTDMMAAFRDTVERNCKNNASPAQCVERHVADSKKPDGADWVRLYLTTFGWQNCAVKYAYRNAGTRTLDQLRAQVEGRFRQAVKIVKGKCDTPVDGHPEFGETAVLDMDVAPGTASVQWNIVAVGLFCGSAKVLPGRIALYLYGISSDRIQTGQPVSAIFDLDGKPVQMQFKAYDDLVLAPVEASFVRGLLNARSASVRIRDYNSPNPDRKLDGADQQVRSALKACYKP